MDRVGLRRRPPNAGILVPEIGPVLSLHGVVFAFFVFGPARPRRSAAASTGEASSGEQDTREEPCCLMVRWRPSVHSSVRQITSSLKRRLAVWLSWRRIHSLK